MKPDLDALADKAAGWIPAGRLTHDEWIALRDAVRRALQEVSQEAQDHVGAVDEENFNLKRRLARHEAERGAAVREAVERAAEMVARNWDTLRMAYEHPKDEMVKRIQDLKPRSDMVCLPREPTQAMRDAFLKAWDEYPGPTQWECFYSAWKAALSAADEQKG